MAFTRSQIRCTTGARFGAKTTALGRLCTYFFGRRPITQRKARLPVKNTGAVGGFRMLYLSRMKFYSTRRIATIFCNFRPPVVGRRGALNKPIVLRTSKYPACHAHRVLLATLQAVYSIAYRCPRASILKRRSRLRSWRATERRMRTQQLQSTRFAGGGRAQPARQTHGRLSVYAGFARRGRAKPSASLPQLLTSQHTRRRVRSKAATYWVTGDRRIRQCCVGHVAGPLRGGS